MNDIPYYPWKEGDKLFASALNAAIANAPMSSSVRVADTPPVGAPANSLWWDSAGTGLYVNYWDGNSLQWVAAQNQNTLGDAPANGFIFGRSNNSWVTVPGGPGGAAPTGPAGGDLSGSYPNPTISSIGANVTVNGEIIPLRLNLGNTTGAGLGGTLAGAPDHTTSPIWENYFFSGTNSNTGNQNFNSIYINDNVAYSGNGQSNALMIQQYGGANHTRLGGLWVEVDQSAAPTNPVSFLTALTAGAAAQYNCGGTSLASNVAAKGTVTTLNTYTSAVSGATFLHGLVGYELDITAAAGSSVGTKTGLLIARLAADAVAGAWNNDCAIVFSGPGSAAGWDYIVNFGGGQGQIPYKATATLIGAWEPQTPTTGQALAAWGIDLSGVKFSGGFARSLGFLVDGSGNVTSQTHNISNWSLTPSSAGLTISAASQRASLTSIAAGGTNWTVGDKATTASGGVYQVTAVAGTVATTVAQLVPDVAASPPANPVAATATNPTSLFRNGGSGLTLNLAWTAANALAIQPALSLASGLGAFGAAAITAKPTVTGAKAGNAALASLMTVLASYGLVTDSTTA